MNGKVRSAVLQGLRKARFQHQIREIPDTLVHAAPGWMELFGEHQEQAVKRFLDDIRRLIKANTAAETEELIRQLNSKIRGWTNYFCHVVAKKTFNYVDQQVIRALIAWINRRHPNKSVRWKHQRYLRSECHRNWVFFATIRDELGRVTFLDLFRASSVPITRHIKIQARATPYDPAFTDYFTRRAQSRRVSRLVWRGMVALA
jgi:RNA-directed DNA polymerase